MIERWREELERLGFRYVTWPTREISFEREQKGFLLSISDHQHRGKTRINLVISINDPYLSDANFGRTGIFHGFLTKDGVETENENVEKLWDSSDSEQALVALTRYAPPWFERHADINWLIGHWERYMAPYARVQPPIRHLYLALLYEVNEKQQEACKHAKAWLEHCLKAPPVGTEPGRTQRQIEKMGCADIEATEPVAGAEKLSQLFRSLIRR